MAQLVTLMMASRSSSISGSGTLSQRMSVVPCHTSAFMMTSVVSDRCGPNGEQKRSFLEFAISSIRGNSPANEGLGRYRNLQGDNHEETRSDLCLHSGAVD